MAPSIRPRLAPALATAAVTAAVVLALPVPTAAAAGYTCDGRPVTMVSTVTGGHVAGTPGDDVILASGYDSSVDAGAGNDLVCMTGPSSTVDAGPGDDVVHAGTDVRDPEQAITADLGSGSDRFTGGQEVDRVTTGPAPGHDVVLTGDNKDFVTLSTSDADVSTGNGKDRVILDAATAGTGTLRLGRAEDVITVTDPNDEVTVDLRRGRVELAGTTYSLRAAEVVNAIAQRAHVVGDRHVNVLNTYACRATVVGGANGDRIKLDAPSGTVDGAAVQCTDVRGRAFGGPGNDTLQAIRGRDVLDGGPGYDKAIAPTAGGPGGHVVCRAEVTRCD